jgi:hypothetical protein
MRENRPSGLEGGARLNTSFLPLSIAKSYLSMTECARPRAQQHPPTQRGRENPSAAITDR